MANETTSGERAVALFKDVKEALEPFPSEKFWRLIPTALQERSDLYRPAVSVVQVNPDDQRDVYPTPGGGGTVCLHSQALERIGNAMGIDWENTAFAHDHAAEPFICLAFVAGWVTDSLGQRRRVTSSAKSDLRDGSPTAQVLKGGLATARQFICERTESRARNRAIKKVGNIPTSFRPDELRKPFVAIRFRLDERDPEVRRALIAQGTRATDAVFGIAAGDVVGPALDAGHAGPDDEVLEAQVREVASEPDVVEPEADHAPAPVAQESGIPAHVESIRLGLRGPDGKPWGDAARKRPATDAQVGLVAGLIAKGIGADKVLDAAAKKALRRAVLAALWGEFREYSELTSDRVSATIEWARDYPAEVRALADTLIKSRPDLASVRDVMAQQPELIAKGAA